MRRLKGCLIILVALLILYLFGKSNEASKSNELPTLAVLALPTSRPDARDTPTNPPSVTIIPTVIVNRSGFVTITPAPGTMYPTATITDTPIPSATNTDAPTDTPTPQITPLEPTIYYTVSSVNLRSCPSTSCSIVQKVGSGAPLAVDGIITGEAVDPGNPYWYKVEQSETDEYGYSRFFSTVPPAQLQPNGQTVATLQSQAPAPSVQQGMIPENCSTAVAMNLSDVQAAQYPNLDRNHNGVACYGS